MDLIVTIGVFLLALIILVTIHEWGHFYVARLFGVRVLRFSIGIGKPFWSRRDKHDTEFALAPIPLGGYVNLLSREECKNYPEYSLDETIESKRIWQRILVLLAGPLANIVLAIFVYAGLLMAGKIELSPVVGKVDSGSVAAQAGLQSGLEITAVDGFPTETRGQVLDRMLLRLGETGDLVLSAKPSDSDLVVDYKLALNEWLIEADIPDPLGDLGFNFYRLPADPVISEVVEGSAADRAGLLGGDKIISLDGQPCDDWNFLVDYISARPNVEVVVEVLREGSTVTKTITPALAKLDGGREVGRIGVMYKSTAQWPKEMLRETRYGPLMAMSQAVVKTWDTSTMILVNIKKLIIGQISTKNLSGPIGIAKVAGDHARAGVKYYIEFLAILSVYLGVFNLLPIPMLDGGQIMNCIAEAIKGGELSDRVRLFTTQLGLAMIGALMIIAFYNDILRLL